jgi:ADP-ribosylglycohydrolase
MGTPNQPHPTHDDVPSDLSTAHPLVLSALHDRAVGVLIGAALGDAIGLYTEFLSAERAAEAYPARRFALAPEPTPFFRDMHRLKHQLGDWTDDTDQALLIVLSFLHGGVLDAGDFAARLRVWVNQGLRALDTLPLGLGQTVGAVVRSHGYVDDPAGIARREWVKRGRQVAPNGAIMRTHPLGVICFNEGETAAFEAAAAHAATTHADPRCVMSCAIGTGLVRGLLRGEVVKEADIDALVGRALDWYLMEQDEENVPDLDPEELKKHTTAASLEDLKLDDRLAIGYTYKCLGSGIMLLRMAMRKMEESSGSVLAQSALFEELITELIMCGGDADTNACFAGALLGGYLGYHALPGHWKHGLRHEAWLMAKAEALCQVLHITKGDYDGKADKDTQPDGGRGFVSMEEMEKRIFARQQDVLLILSKDFKEKALAERRRSAWNPFRR